MFKPEDCEPKTQTTLSKHQSAPTEESPSRPYVPLDLIHLSLPPKNRHSLYAPGSTFATYLPSKCADIATEYHIIGIPAEGVGVGVEIFDDPAH